MDYPVRSPSSIDQSLATRSRIVDNSQQSKENVPLKTCKWPDVVLNDSIVMLTENKSDTAKPPFFHIVH